MDRLNDRSVFALGAVSYRTEADWAPHADEGAPAAEHR